VRKCNQIRGIWEGGGQEKDRIYLTNKVREKKEKESERVGFQSLAKVFVM